MAFEDWDSDCVVDKLISEYDDSEMPLPDIEFEPHLLISKVRKHYMEYMIKLLSVNYETNQRLLNKNIYLPSAIWRCAKAIEMTAAQACMVVQLYRKNIITVVKELKAETKKGKMFKKLFECLSKPPVNEKKTQATINHSGDWSCQCTSVKRKRRHKNPALQKGQNVTVDQVIDNQNICHEQFKIPVAINLQSEPAQPLAPNEFNINNFSFIPPKHIQPQPPVCNQPIISPPKAITPVETQESDELMMQLEKLFQSDQNDDDIFEGALCDTLDADTTSFSIVTDNSNKVTNTAPNSIIENHAAQIKSLDERLATLAGLLVTNNDTNTVANESNVVEQKNAETLKSKKQNSSKWLCEEYFLKQRLYELLDQIGDTNRKDLARIKEKFAYLFGNDSDVEDVLSPLEETSEFIISCKERIAPWVVKLLTPFYIKGRIRGKVLFKSLAKHLIRLIYQCSKYPEEYEVNSFVSDFLENHKLIRSEADFKQFRIDNI